MAKTPKINILSQNPCVLLGGAIVEAKSFQAGATPSYFATFGITDAQEAQNLLNLSLQAFHAALGEPTGEIQNCVKTGAQAAQEHLMSQELKWRGHAEFDSKMQMANTMADIYRPFAAIVKLSSKYPIVLSHFVNGNVTELGVDMREFAKNDLFYAGAKVYFEGQLYGRRRKTFDAKDGVSGFLQQILFHSHGDKLFNGGTRKAAEVFKGFKGISTVNPLAPAPQSFVPPQAPAGYAPPQAPAGYAPPMAAQPAAPTGYAPPQPPAYGAVPQNSAPQGYTPPQFNGGYPQQPKL